MNYKTKLFETLYEQQIPFYFPMGSEVSLAKKIDIKYLKTVKELISYMHMNYASNFSLYNKY